MAPGGVEEDSEERRQWELAEVGVQCDYANWYSILRVTGCDLKLALI